MQKLVIFGTSTVAGYVTWWLADTAGFEFFTAFLLSGAGSVAGCVLGWKLYQRFLN